MEEVRKTKEGLFSPKYYTITKGGSSVQLIAVLHGDGTANDYSYHLFWREYARNFRFDKK